MNPAYYCLIYLIIGYFLAEFCFAVVHIWQIDQDIDSLFNRIMYGLHFMGLVLSIIAIGELMRIGQKLTKEKDM